MQVKSPSTPANPVTGPFPALNPGQPSPGSPAEGAGGSATFAQLMESQASQLAKNAAAQMPQALSANTHAQSAAATPRTALNDNAGGKAPSTAGKSTESKNAVNTANAPGGARALAQQQIERNRLNAQRDARAAAAASSPDRTNAGTQAKAQTAQADAAQAEKADAQDEEGTTGEKDGVAHPQALLDLIQQAAQARNGAAGAGQPSEQDVRLTEAQEGGDAAKALAGAAATQAAGLPAGDAPSSDAAVSEAPTDPLEGAAGPSPSVKTSTGKAARHGLNTLGDAPSSSSAAVGASAKEAASAATGGRTGALAFAAEMAAAQQADAAGPFGQVGQTANAARGPAGPAPGGVDALNSGNPAAIGGPAPTPANDFAAPVSVDIPTPAQSPEFRKALGAEVSLLAKDGVQSAELHLNPSDMGPISVQITLDGTQARVDFGADSADTRRLIESGLPELASALRDAGLTLSGGGVSQHAPQQQNRGDAGQGGEGRRAVGLDTERGGAAVDAHPVRSAAVARRVALGGVDVYA